MNPAYRHQLTRLDRAVLSLLDERARLVNEMRDEEGGRATVAGGPDLDDLLHRSTGDFPARAVREVFRAVRSGCTGRGEQAP